MSLMKSRPRDAAQAGLEAPVEAGLNMSQRKEGDRFEFLMPDQLHPHPNQPRRIFNAEALQELADSIAAHGVLQPLLVRPKGAADRFEIVAGERRWRASKLVGLAMVPALIREMTDEEARAASLAENVIREQMLLTEESDAAVCVMADCNNDRERAARQLGWSTRKLDARLQLQNLTSDTRNAYEGNQLKKGHVWLLAGCEASTQSDVLKLILSESLTVDATRKVVMSLARDLDQACFDTADCTSCTHNATAQSDLFAEGGQVAGRCMNSQCFDAKSAKHVDDVARRLRETYPLVRIQRVGERRPDVVSPALVGERQFAACQMCASYGATVSHLPNQCGHVTEHACFDPACNAEMVLDNAPADMVGLLDAVGQGAHDETDAQAEEGGQQSGSECPPAALDGAASDGEDADDDGDAGAGTPAADVVYRLTPRMQAYRDRLWRDALAHWLDRQAAQASGASASRVADAAMLAAQVRSGGLSIETVRSLGSALGVDVAELFVFGEDFLSLLAASEIRGVCESIGMGEFVRKDKGGKRRFQSLTCGTKADIIAAVTSVPGFDYTRAVPPFMHYSMPAEVDASAGEMAKEAANAN